MSTGPVLRQGRAQPAMISHHGVQPPEILPVAGSIRMPLGQLVQYLRLHNPGTHSGIDTRPPAQVNDGHCFRSGETGSSLQVLQPPRLQILTNSATIQPL